MHVSANVLLREVGDEALLLDLDSGRCFMLNTTGRQIWSMLSEGAGPDEIVAALVARFDVDEGQARADVDETLAALRERGLVEGGPPAPGS